MKFEYVWNNSVNRDEWTIDMNTKALTWIQSKLSEILHMGGSPEEMKNAADAYYKIAEAIKERDQKQGQKDEKALENDPTLPF